MKAKFACEADVEGYARVYLPTPAGGIERAWVRILEGGKEKGKGALIQQPLRAQYSVGQVVVYKGGTSITYARVTRRVHTRNRFEDLKTELTESLQEAMTRFTARPKHESRSMVSRPKVG